MITTPASLGQYVAFLKATRDQLSDREAFVVRSQRKYDAPTVAGLPMVGLEVVAASRHSCYQT